MSAPWWRTRHVAFAVFFRGLLFWGIFTALALGYWIVRRIMEDRMDSWADLEILVRESFLGCTVVGLVIGCGFGIPLGIVQVLGIRSSQLDLEQEMEAESGSSGKGLP